MIAREVPVARLVVRPADRDLDIRRLHQGEGAHHLAPHAVDGGGRERPLMGLEALAHDLRLAAGPERQPARRLGSGDAIDQGCAAPDQAMQFAVDGIDFLAQAVETGGVHEAVGCPVRQRRYYVRPAPVKARNLRAACTIPATSV
jgi:hypothetical protein